MGWPRWGAPQGPALPGGKGGEAGRDPLLRPRALSRGCGLQLSPGSGPRAVPQCQGEVGTGVRVLRCWARVLHSPAASVVGPARPRSAGSECSGAPWCRVLVSHNPAAPAAGPARPRSTWCKFRAAVQHQRGAPRGPTAPAAAPARPRGANLGAWHSPVAGFGGPGGHCCGVPAWRSPAVLRRNPLGPAVPFTGRVPARPAPAPAVGRLRSGRPSWCRSRQCRREAGSRGGTTGKASGRRQCRGRIGTSAALGTAGTLGERVQFLTYPTHVFF